MKIKIEIKKLKVSDKHHLSSKQTYKASVYEDRSKFNRNKFKKNTLKEIRGNY